MARLHSVIVNRAARTLFAPRLLNNVASQAGVDYTPMMSPATERERRNRSVLYLRSTSFYQLRRCGALNGGLNGTL